MVIITQNPKKMSKAHLHVIKDDAVLNLLKPVSDFALLKQN